jgi:hypothetical protein
MLTMYRIATDADIQALKNAGKLTVEVAYPTIIAARAKADNALAWTDQEAIVGFLGTHNRQDTVMAGPFEAINPFIGSNLVELYENCLKSAGLKMYWFHVKPGEWMEVVGRSDRVIKIHENEDGSVIYRRML